MTHIMAVAAMLLSACLLAGASKSSCEDGVAGSCAAPASALLQQTRGSSMIVSGKEEPSLLVGQTQGIARLTLPDSLMNLGLQLLGKESVLDDIVAGTAVTHLSYAGQGMTLRFVNGDLSLTGVEDMYGLETFSSDVSLLAQNGTMNMLDIGGNYGLVTIAAYKMHPDRMRILTLEPNPSTYFLLKWNLHLNNIPELTQQEFQASPSRPGVLILNNGISGTENKQIGICYTPPYTMNARLCDCNAETGVSASGQQCHLMTTRTLESMFDMFGTQPLHILKMDCEGCEFDAIPSLDRLMGAMGRKVGRFVGELHAPTSDLEDFACKFESGKWFVEICCPPGQGCDTIPLTQQCEKGSGQRAVCKP